MPLIRNVVRRLRVYKSWWELPGFVIVIVGVVATADRYIDWKIDKKLSDEALLKRVGQSARPFCIFDNKGRIHFDSGAMQFIGSTVNPGKDCFDFANLTKGGFPQQITVHFNRLFGYPPTLTVIGQGLTTSTATRGTGYDWIYTVYSAEAIVNESSTSPPPSNEQDYRLDILF